MEINCGERLVLGNALGEGFGVLETTEDFTPRTFEADFGIRGALTTSLLLIGILEADFEILETTGRVLTFTVFMLEAVLGCTVCEADLGLFDNPVVDLSGVFFEADPEVFNNTVVDFSGVFDADLGVVLATTFGDFFNDDAVSFTVLGFFDDFALLNKKLYWLNL